MARVEKPVRKIYAYANIRTRKFSYRPEFCYYVLVHDYVGFAGNVAYKQTDIQIFAYSQTQTVANMEKI